MLKHSVFIVLIFHPCIHFSTASLPEDIVHTSTDCLTNSLESSIYCRGSRAIRNIINNLSKTEKPIVIVRGFEIVPSNTHNINSTNNADNNHDDVGIASGDTDDTFLGHFSHYLRTHDLNIKFSDLMTDESERDLARDLEQSGMQINLSDEARKKDKGSGMILAVAVMMSKMMALLMGLGGVGALAMKALGVALTALMLAAMVGIKSIAQHGHESSHSVQYVTADGHHHKRRRRSTNVTASTISLFKRDAVKSALPPLPYRAWQ